MIMVLCIVFLSKKFSFSKSKSSISYLLLFLVLVTQSIKYLDGLTVSVQESMKCFTTEHDFTFFVMCDFVRYVRGFQFSVDPTHCLPPFCAIC